MRLRYATPGSILLVLSAAETALACGMCAFAGFDQIIAPIFLWTVLSLGWFAAHAVIARMYEFPIPLTPAVWKAVVLTLIAFVLGSAFVGPLFAFVLGFIALIAFLRTWSGAPHAGRTAVRVTGILVLAAMAGLLAYNASLQKERGKEGFILQWETTAPAHQAFNRLQENPAENLRALRTIATESQGEFRLRSAALLAEYGTAEDVSRARIILKDASEAPFGYDQRDLQRALEIVQRREASSPQPSTAPTITLE